MRLIETGIVNIYQSEKNGTKIILARELYKSLELASGQFSRWATLNIIENNFFSENVDFYRVRLNVEGNEVDDFVMKIDMAKHLVMLSRTEKAHQFREYLISIEEKYKQSMLEVSNLSPELQLMNNMLKFMANQELEMKRVKETANSALTAVAGIRETFVQEFENWREEINTLFNKVQKATGVTYQDLRQETYSKLETRGRCDLSIRLKFLKDRMKADGATATKINSMSKLDVIEADAKLKEIYTQIIKEYAIKFVE